MPKHVGQRTGRRKRRGDFAALFALATWEFDLPKMLNEIVPAQIHELLEREHLNGAPVLLATTADLNLPGQLRQQWIVVNREHLTVVDPASPRVKFRLPLRQAEKFRAHLAVGSGFLQAFVEGVWVDVARFSTRLTPQFQSVAESLEQLRTSGNVTGPDLPLADRSQCPKCRQTLIHTDAVCEHCLPRRALLKKLWHLVRPHWAATSAICLLMTVSVLLELIPPKLQQYLVDHILVGGQAAPHAGPLLAALGMLVTALVVTRLVQAVVNWSKRLLANQVGVRLTSELRAQLVQKLQSQGIGYFDQHEIGSLTSRVVNDSEVMHSVVQQITGGFLLQIVQIIAIGAMLFSLNAKLALYTLIPAPFVFGLSIYFWRRVYPNYYRYWEFNSKQSGTVAALLGGIRVVKAFAQEPNEYERFRRSSDEVRRARVRVDQATASFSAVMSFTFSLGGLIVWYVGGRDVLGNEMTLGSLMAFLAYLGMFYEPMSTLSEFSTWSTSVLTGCQRVFELLDAPIPTAEPAEPIRVANPRGEVHFEGVTFGYEPHRPVLENLHFSIRSGERIGIVGRSGSGKSTIVNLINRFYDVNHGRVLIDGVDVRRWASCDLRRHIGVVLQEPFLFRGTICDNLKYGRPDADPETVLAAARSAQAHDFILRKTLAYDSCLHERGAGLSGGEKQRISIARALVYDPRILILDEATSSVDTEAEAEIQLALREASRGRTVIAIAHRLSTLRDCDRIFVIDQGRLEEQGTHRELMQRNGRYAQLVRIQSRFGRDLRMDSSYAAIADLDDMPASPDAPRAGAADTALRWLEPGLAVFSGGPHDSLQLDFPEGPRIRGLTATCCFPASFPDAYISLRACGRDGRESEIGIVRDLNAWPGEAQRLVRRSLSRNFFHRQIRGINRVSLRDGHLHFDVRTDEGPAQVTMRWNQSEVHDFGAQGKVLVDLNGDHLLVPDVRQLPRRDRRLLERYIY